MKNEDDGKEKEIMNTKKEIKDRYSNENENNNNSNNILDELYLESGYGYFQYKQIILTAIAISLEGIHFYIISALFTSIKLYYMLSDAQIDLLSSICSLGFGFGAFITTILLKYMSRKTVLILGSFIMTILVFLFTLTLKFGLLVLLRFLIGFCIGMKVPTMTNILAEFLPMNYRGFILTSVWAGFGLGQVILITFIYIVMPGFEEIHINKLLLVLVPYHFIIFLIFCLFLDDSPRSLLCNNYTEEAFVLIEKIIKRLLNEKEKRLLESKYKRVMKDNNANNDNTDRDGTLRVNLFSIVKHSYFYLIIIFSIGQFFGAIVVYGPMMIQDLEIEILINKYNHDSSNEYRKVINDNDNIELENNRIKLNNNKLVKITYDDFIDEMNLPHKLKINKNYYVPISNDKETYNNDYIGNIGENKEISKGNFLKSSKYTYSHTRVIDNKLSIGNIIKIDNHVNSNNDSLLSMNKRFTYTSLTSLHSTSNSKIPSMYIIAIIGAFGNLFGGVLSELPFLGRRGVIIFSTIANIIIGFLMIINSKNYILYSGIGLNLAFMFLNVYYIYNSEIIPSKIRDIAIGLLFTSMRLGTFVSQFIYNYLFKIHYLLPFYFNNFSIFVCFLMVYLVEYETFGKELDYDYVNAQTLNSNINNSKKNDEDKLNSNESISNLESKI